LTKGKTGLSTAMAYDPAFAITAASQIQDASTTFGNRKKILEEGGRSAEEATKGALESSASELVAKFAEKGITLKTDEAATLIKNELETGASGIGKAVADALTGTALKFDATLKLIVDANGAISQSQVVTSGISGVNSGPGMAGDTNGDGVVDDKDDTSTPRIGRVGDTATGRWGRTLGKHMAFTQGIAGRRTITSGLRNTNLGSGMSDHRFGNAYDLTGDNLGQYASTINGAGGFAEFHGSAGSRHLHVVPPSGDTSTPMGSMSGSSGGDTYSYNISVQGGPNSNADEIAQKVMTLIQNTQRSNRERQ